MEDSAAIYKGYIFMTDNGGNLMCLDLNTLQLVWVQDTLDDSNSTPVLEIEKGHLYLYVSTSSALDGEVMTQPLSLSGRLMQKPVRSCGIQIMNVLLMTVFPVEFSLRLPVERTALPIIYM